ncbi:hypothetical protein AMV250 [Betaentomopoxvirus amoorei]|uniref:AMV250 n=1 Tax=Amsacta moorei entomopoxvirus TaxID=28321 RepID=Q9EMF6_AMEPV|nr:hypothetical protein AMV250 [Amsacta moorei entomopoxvirus]AAG02956.1 AMV250 [Amsacta moorei entomopoxvirus]
MDVNISEYVDMSGYKKIITHNNEFKLRKYSSSDDIDKALILNNLIKSLSSHTYISIIDINEQKSQDNNSNICKNKCNICCKKNNIKKNQNIIKRFLNIILKH